MDFWRAVEVLGKRKWLILFSIVVTVALTLGASRLVGNRWQARVQFFAYQTQLVTGLPTPGQSATMDEISNNANKANAQAIAHALLCASVVRTDLVVQPAMKKLGLSKPPMEVINTVDFKGLTQRLYEMNVYDSQPRRAEAIANALAEAFVPRMKDVFSEFANKGVTTLNDQLKGLNTKLTLAREKVEDYKQTHNILDTAMPGERVAAGPNYRQQREQLDQTLADQQARLAEKQAALALTPATVQTPMMPKGPSMLRNQLEALVDTAESHYNTIRQRYPDTHPTVKQAKAALDDAKARLDKVVKREQVVTMVEQRNPVVGIIQGQIANLKENIAGTSAKLKKLDEIAPAVAGAATRNRSGSTSQLLALQGEAAQLDDERRMLVQRLNTALMVQDSLTRQRPMEIMQKVSNLNPPMNTSAGRTTKLVMLGIICALIGSCAIIVALDSVDRRVKSVRDAHGILPARVLAAIPQPVGTVTYSTLARATELQPHSLHAESYRFIAQHLLGDSGPRVRSIMALAAKAEQGSTSTITNLGITLAQAGKRVVIVDANIRTSELHRVFSLSNDFGFTNVLEDPSLLPQALRPTTTKNLSIITSGPTPSNPWQLFRSPNLSEVSRRLLEMADYVLYDTPSSLLFTDALNLAPVVDAAVLCVRALEPLTGAEKRLVELLEQSGVNVLGSVLNDVPASVLDGYENYRHYYGQPVAAVPVLVATERTDGNGNNSASSPVVVEVTASRTSDRDSES